MAMHEDQLIEAVRQRAALPELRTDCADLMPTDLAAPTMTAVGVRQVWHI
jgi:hypothetical protein